MDTYYNNNYNVLANLFSKNFISKIFNDNYKQDIDNIIKEFHIKYTNNSLAELFETVYKYLLKNYRCEYIYKNAIVSKILLGKHSLNTSVLFNEMVVGNSIADLVMINGTSTVFEIKTELDSLDRLSGQLNSYMCVFDYIYVVTYEKNISKISELVPEQIGIMILSDKYTLRVVKKAKSNKSNTSSEDIFDILRKEEYLEIIKKKIGNIPDVPNTYIYRVCKNIFAQFSPGDAHDAMVQVLKKRNVNETQKKLVNNAPYSLKLFTLYEYLNEEQCKKLNGILNS